MNRNTRIIISSVVILVTAVGIYFGSIAPVKKSKLYLDHYKSLARGGEVSVQDIMDGYDRAFNFYSPAGDKELPKFYTDFIVSIVKNQNLSEEAFIYLLNHAEENIYQDNVIHLLRMVQLYDIAFRMTKDEQYLDKIEEYLLKTHEIGPNLPHPLEGLAVVYSIENDVENLEDIVEELLELWPDHPAVEESF